MYAQERSYNFMYFYHRIRDIREDSDLKQLAIAIELGITQPQYQLYESGKREIPVHLLIRLCEFYGVSLDWITGRSDSKCIK